jgi:hypothetical protein
MYRQRLLQATLSLLAETNQLFQYIVWLANKEMQRTSPGQKGGSPLISVFYGRPVGG